MNPLQNVFALLNSSILSILPIYGTQRQFDKFLETVNKIDDENKISFKTEFGFDAALKDIPTDERTDPERKLNWN